MQTVAEYVMGTLKESGVDLVFGYPGQSNLLLLHAASVVGIRYVQTSDERSAGFAASGYILSTGKPAMVCASKGPATTNLLTSLVSARKDAVPLFVVTGNVAEKYRGRNAFQEFDGVSSFKAAGAVKAAAYCASRSELPQALEELFRIAWTIPYGPVLLDLPHCVLSESLTAEPRAVEVHEPGPADYDLDEFESQLRQSAEAIKLARRPLMVVGRGSREDWQLVRQASGAYAIPVVHTIGGTGIVSTEDALYGGLLRHNGHPQAGYLAKNADTVIALGTGLDDRATAGGSAFAPCAFRIQVDVDEDVLRRADFADLRLRMPIGPFLNSLAAQIGQPLDRADWTHTMKFPALQLRSSGSRFMTAGEVLQAIHDELFESIIVKDSGSHKYWVTKLAPCTRPENSIASCHFGSMGFAIPAGIGACIANPDRTVVPICGDGCLLMSISELRTAVREKCANLKIIVFNNAGLGSTRDYERRLAPMGPRVSDFGEHSQIAEYADAFGIESHRIRDATALSTMKTRMKQPGLVLFDCLIDPSEAMHDSVLREPTA
jgi:acetolactate synthase-1/2/3 large subunit